MHHQECELRERMHRLDGQHGCTVGQYCTRCSKIAHGSRFTKRPGFAGTVDMGAATTTSRTDGYNRG
jgi:hypothetical protein